MEEKAPLAHGDEQVLPITAAPFIVLLGFDRNSSGISKRQIELFALGIPDSDSETDSPPPPPLLKQKLNPHVVMDLPRQGRSQKFWFGGAELHIYIYIHLHSYIYIY